MTRGQVLDPNHPTQYILVPFLHHLLCAVPIPATFHTCCPHLHPITAGLHGLEHEDCAVWRELGLAASLTRAEVGSVIIQYNSPGPLSVLSDSQTNHRPTV